MDAPVSQITVELAKEIAEQLVDVPIAQILGILWQACGSYHCGCMLACPFFRGNCCGDPVHSARAHCRCSSASVQEQIVGVFRRSGVVCIAEQIMVCQCHRSCRKRGGVQLVVNAHTVPIVATCHRSWRKSRSLQLARWLG